MYPLLPYCNSFASVSSLSPQIKQGLSCMLWIINLNEYLFLSMINWLISLSAKSVLSFSRGKPGTLSLAWIFQQLNQQILYFCKTGKKIKEKCSRNFGTTCILFQSCVSNLHVFLLLWISVTIHCIHFSSKGLWGSELTIDSFYYRA